jgi:outer membrane protein
MKTRITQGISAICCALVFVVPQLHAETLKDIYLQALENDHTFKVAQADRDAGLENKSLGRSALLPQINGSGSWDKTQLDTKVGSGQRLAGEYDLEGDAYGASLQQSIIDLSNWHNYARGKALANAASAEFAVAEQDLILRTSNAYFDALRAVDNLATAKAEEDALSHQLEQTKQRFAVGLTAITEVHEAQAAFDSATADRLVADGLLGIAFEALEVLTGQSYTSLSPLHNEFPVQPPQPAVREEWVEMALENNARLKVTSFAADSAEAGAKAAKSAHLPTLSGSLNYGHSEQDLEDLTIEDQDAATVRLDLSIPLYSGGRVSATRRQAYNQYLSAREQHLQTQRDTVQDTRSSHLAVLTSAATVKARQQAITSGRSALEATQAGYDVGTRDLVDVLNAQRNLYSAQRDYFNALYTYVVATLRLKQAAGVLVAADISELDQWLDKSRPVNYIR